MVFKASKYKIRKFLTLHQCLQVFGKIVDISLQNKTLPFSSGILHPDCVPYPSVQDDLSADGDSLLEKSSKVRDGPGPARHQH